MTDNARLGLTASLWGATVAIAALLWFTDRRPSPTAAEGEGNAVSSAQVAALTRAIEALNALLLEERERGEGSLERPAPMTAVRAPASGSSELGELRVAIEALTKSVDIATGGGALGGPARSAHTGGGNDPPTVVPSKALSELESLRVPKLPEATYKARVQARRDRHMLWTYRQVANHYGMPTEVFTGNGGVSWLYEDEEIGRSTVFYFVDGVVVRIQD